jgi:hypothetical protein
MSKLARFAVAAVLVLVPGCYGLPAATESAVRDGIAVNQGHANDTTLPSSTRLVALDNHDLLWQILYGAGSVEDLPEDVRARMAMREGDVAPVTTGGGE